MTHRPRTLLVAAALAATSALALAGCSTGGSTGDSLGAAPAHLAGTVSLLALPSAVLAFSTNFEPKIEPSPAGSIQAIDSAATPPRLARAIPIRSLAKGPLYPFTPAGTPIGLFDPDEPDFDRYPLAREAMRQAAVAELEPGDAIFIPHMWWHHVRSLDPVSILVNYWWDEAPAPQPGLAPIDTMVHAILAFSGLPENQRAAWRAMFDEFVFGGVPGHVPEGRRGIRGALSEESKARVRRQLGQMMTR